jgi:hypothetical protein
VSNGIRKLGIAFHRHGKGPVGLIGDLHSPDVTREQIGAAIDQCGLPTRQIREFIDHHKPRWFVGIAVPKRGGSSRILCATKREQAILAVLSAFERFNRFAGNWSCQRRFVYLCDDDLIRDIQSMMTPNGPSLQINGAAEDRYEQAALQPLFVTGRNGFLGLEKLRPIIDPSKDVQPPLVATVKKVAP